MNKEELKSRLKEIDERIDVINNEAYDLRQEWRANIEALSLIYGESAYGLKVGDRIRFTKKTYRKTEEITIQVTGFGISTSRHVEDIDDFNKKPTINGIRVLKSGQLGVKEENWWAHENIPFEKVTQ